MSEILINLYHKSDATPIPMTLTGIMVSCGFVKI